MSTRKYLGPMLAALVFVSVGTITFASGEVDVTRDVDEPDLRATGDLTTWWVTNEASAPTGLAAVLPAEEQSVDLGLWIRISADWEQVSALAACVDVAMSAPLTSSGHDGFSALLTEVSGNAQLCIGTTDGEAWAELTFARKGSATTPTFTAFGDQDYGFLTLVTFRLPRVIFDGDTLHLDDLLGTQVVPAEIYAQVSARPTGSTAVRARWYGADFDGTMTFHFGTTP